MKTPRHAHGVSSALGPLSSLYYAAALDNPALNFLRRDVQGATLDEWAVAWEANLLRHGSFKQRGPHPAVDATQEGRRHGGRDRESRCPVP